MMVIKDIGGIIPLKINKHATRSLWKHEHFTGTDGWFLSEKVMINGRISKPDCFRRVSVRLIGF
jgi:hypothetical protein